MTTLKPALIAFVLFIIFDFLWLGYVMKDFNVRALAEIGRIEGGEFKVKYWAAACAYLLMALSIVIYILPQLSPGDSMLTVFLRGAVMGFIVFGVFDFTNMAILKSYPLTFVAADIAWGTFNYGLVTFIVSRFTES